MATRIEKVFRTNTVIAMNTMLNEISECVENLKAQKRLSKTDITNSLSKTVKIIDDFFKKHNISDEEIIRSVNR